MARTNIDLDEGLLREARELSRLKTKREVVNTALAFFVRYERLKGSMRYYGTPNRWQEIYNANRDVLQASSTLRVGMQLRIP